MLFFNAFSTIVHKANLLEILNRYPFKVLLLFRRPTHHNEHISLQSIKTSNAIYKTSSPSRSGYPYCLSSTFTPPFSRAGSASMTSSRSSPGNKVM